MPFQADPQVIRWRLHLRASPETVYAALATDAGRASFWAERADARDGVIHFVFPNGATWAGRIVRAEPPRAFALRYYGDSLTTFELEDDGQGGTDLTLTDAGVPEADRTEVMAGWVSVLLALKGYVDFGIDLRAHDAARQWDSGYAEN